MEYEVFIDNQSIGVTNHNYMEVRDLVDDVTYEWYVIASDGIGGIATSATWFFTVNAENNPPSEFALLQPSNEALFKILFTLLSNSSLFDFPVLFSKIPRCVLSIKDFTSIFF